MNAPPDLGSLLNVGAVGAICGYLLLRTSSQISDLGKKIDRLSRAILIQSLGRPDDPRVKRQAQQLLDELEDG